MLYMTKARYLASATLILLIAFALRVHHLAYSSIWFDEGFSIMLARMSLYDMSITTGFDMHPPVYFALLHGWIFGVGQSEFALRYLGVLFSLVVVATTGMLAFSSLRKPGHLPMGRQVGAISMLFVALSILQIGWAKEIKMYSLTALIVSVAVWLTLRLLKSSGGSWKDSVWLGVINGLGLLTWYGYLVALIVLSAGFACVLIITSERKRLIIRGSTSGLISGLIYLPWYVIDVIWTPTIWPDNSWVDYSFLELIVFYFSVLLTGISSYLGNYIILIGIGMAAILMSVGYALSRAWPEKRIEAIVYGLSFIASIAYILAIYMTPLKLQVPPPAPRYLISLSIPVYILIAWGAAELMNDSAGRRGGIFRIAGAGVVAVLTGSALWQIGMDWNKINLHDTYISAAHVLHTLRQPGDKVVLNNDADWVVFEHYYPQKADLMLQMPIINTLDDARYWLRPVMDAEGVWLVQNRFAASTDYHGKVAQFLESRSLATRYLLLPEAKIWFFAMTEERARPEIMDRIVQPPANVVPVQAAIADSVEVIGITQALPVLKSGSLAAFGLMWRSTDNQLGTWPVALSVSNSKGVIVATGLAQLNTSRAGEYYMPVRVNIPPVNRREPIEVGLIAGTKIIPLTKYYVMPADPVDTIQRVPESAQRLGLSYAGGIHLQAFEGISIHQWKPGQAIHLTLYWQVDVPVTEYYKVFVHVLGEQVNPATGTMLWAQHDELPANGTIYTATLPPGSIIADSHTVHLPDDLPAGHYRIEVGLYPLLNGPNLTLIDPNGNPLPGVATIAEFDIQP